MDEVHVTLILSKFDEINRQLADDRRDSAESRRRMYERQDQIATNVATISNRVDGLEKSVNHMSPTVAEYLDYKSQVRGAGKLGKFLWFLGGIILTVAAALVTSWNWVIAALRSKGM